MRLGDAVLAEARDAGALACGATVRHALAAGTPPSVLRGLGVRDPALRDRSEVSTVCESPNTVQPSCSTDQIRRTCV